MNFLVNKHRLYTTIFSVLTFNHIGISLNKDLSIYICACIIHFLKSYKFNRSMRAQYFFCEFQTKK